MPECEDEGPVVENINIDTSDELQWMSTTSLRFLESSKMVICISCQKVMFENGNGMSYQKVILPEEICHHLIHHKQKPNQELINILSNRLVSTPEIMSSSYMKLKKDPVSPILGLRMFPGFQCQCCYYVCRKISSMKKHAKSHLPTEPSNSSVPVIVQNLFHEQRKKVFFTVTQPNPLLRIPNDDAWRIVSAEIKEMQRAPDVLDDNHRALSLTENLVHFQTALSDHKITMEDGYALANDPNPDENLLEKTCYSFLLETQTLLRQVPFGIRSRLSTIRS